ASDVDADQVQWYAATDDGTHGSRIADVDARVDMALESVLLDEDVLDCSPTDELVGVYPGARGAAGHVVVLNQIVLDERLGTSVGQADSDDVVLDDVVQNPSAADTRVQPDAVAREGRANAVLHGEPIDDDIAR